MNNLFVLALVYASTALPFTIYLLSGYFRSLAKDFEEAAYVDGASYFTTMVKINFPDGKTEYCYGNLVQFPVILE